jgi:hypothetical protein
MGGSPPPSRIPYRGSGIASDICPGSVDREPEEAVFNRLLFDWSNNNEGISGTAGMIRCRAARSV